MAKNFANVTQSGNAGAESQLRITSLCSPHFCSVGLKALLLMQTKGVSTNPRFGGPNLGSGNEELGMRNYGTTPYRRVWMENLAYYAS